MQAGAVLVVSKPRETAQDGWGAPENAQSSTEPALACVEILGQSVLERTIHRLQQAGVNLIDVVAQDGLAGLVTSQYSPAVGLRPVDSEGDSWFVADRLLKEQAMRGAEHVLLIGLDAYAEFDVAELLRFHHRMGRPLTRARDFQGPLSFCVVDTDTLGETAYRRLLQLRESNEADSSFGSYTIMGYVRRLTGSRDLRRLVVDAFLRRCTLTPGGQEVKPGVWIDDAAFVHRASRIVAPAYIGRRAKVSECALITRFSNVESGCHVDCGAMIEDSSVLADTYVGRGLDVAHAVVAGNTFVHLRRNLVMKIDDGNLFRTRRKIVPSLFTMAGSVKPRNMFLM